LKPDNSSLGNVAHGFRTTRWTVVLLSAQSQAPGFQAALGELCRTYWYALYAFIRRSPESSYEAAGQKLGLGVGTVKTLIYRLRKRYMAIVREEVGRTGSDPSEIGDELRSLCDALVACEGRLDP
jgi:hypothetical protein